MLRSTLSLGRLASFAFWIAVRSLLLVFGSEPPCLTALMISFMMRVKIFPFFLSDRSLRCLIFAHLLWPATIHLLKKYETLFSPDLCLFKEGKLPLFIPKLFCMDGASSIDIHLSGIDSMKHLMIDDKLEKIKRDLGMI